MKLGIAAARTPAWPKMDWIEQAARNLGHDVHRSTDWRSLAPLLRECEVVIFGQKNLAEHWPSIREAMATRTAKVLYWWFDLIATQPGVPVSQQPIFGTFANLLRASDLVLVKERDLLPEYRDAGVNAHWCEQGCPSWIPEAVPAAAGPKWDVLVWGQAGPYRQRVRDVQVAVRAGFSAAWACGLPNGIPAGVERLPFTSPLELPRLAAQASCVLSCGARNDVAGYVSDSFWLALGMGSCVVRRRTPGIPDGPYLTYHSEDELCDALRWVRKNPERARAMGQKARAWVLAEHSTERWVREALSLAARTAAAPGSRPCPVPARA